MAFGALATPEQLRLWRGHPVSALLLRVFAFVLPLAVSFGVSTAVARAVPRPDGFWPTVAWWIGLLAVSTTALVLVHRLARRLLPLAALLKLSMVFPDKAPARFSFAIRRGTTHQLEKRLEEFRLKGTAESGARCLLTLVAALTAHDPRTRGHSERVRALSDLLAAQLGLNTEDRERLHWAALLHDIGKLAVSTEILNKKGKPTDEEWAILKTHPDEGMSLIHGPIAEWLGDWALAVGEHHEKFDGTGYPNGLAGHEISLAGRLVAVADVFDVITATRSYKRPMTAQEARLEITRCAGTHFDPVMVRAFLDISIGKLRKVMGPFSWLAPAATLGRALPGAPGVTAVATGAAVTAGLAVGVVPTTTALADHAPAKPSVAMNPHEPPTTGGRGGPIVVNSEPNGGRDGSGDSSGVAADGNSRDGRGGVGVADGTLPGLSTSGHQIGSPPVTGSTLPDGHTTESTMPSVLTTTTLPKVTGVSVPSTSAPLIVTPGVSIPGVPITIPSLAVTVPSVISVPPITLPPATVPTVSLPPVTVLGLPPVTVPEVSVAPVTLPPVTLPPVTLPHLPGL